MNEISVKKVLRTIKFCNKLDVNHHQQAISPKCSFQTTYSRFPTHEKPPLMTDITHKKVLTFSNNPQCFRSIKKTQTALEPLPKRIQNEVSSLSNITNEISTDISAKKPEENKPKKKLMSKKKNLIITDFLQFEDEKNENKENKEVLGLDEIIKENLVNKHLKKKDNLPIFPKTSTAALIRKKAVSPKFSCVEGFAKKGALPELKKTKIFDNQEKNLIIGKSPSIFNLGLDSNIISCCYDYEDYFLAFGSDDSLIRVYKSADQKLNNCFSDPENYGVPITSLKFKPVSIDNILISTRVNGVISLWNVEKNHLISSLQEDNYIFTCEYNREGSKFATAGYDTKIRVYDHNRFQCIRTLQKDPNNDDFLGHTNRIYCLKYKPDHPDIVFSGGWDETVFQWDTRMEKHVDYIHGPLICGDALDVRGNYILTGSWREDHKIQIWDIRNKKISLEIPWENNKNEPKKRNQIYTCQFNKTNDRFIAAGSTGSNEIRIFDKNENYKCVDIISGFEKPIFTLNFDHMEQRLAFGSGNGLCGVIEI